MSELTQFNKLGSLLQYLERGAITGLFLILTLLAFLQIVLRNFFATGFVWSDTVLRHMVLWIAYLGAARATAENDHIHINVLERLLPPRGRSALDHVAAFFSLAVTLALLAASILFIRDELQAGYYAFEGVPFWILETIFPLSFGLMAARLAVRLFSRTPAPLEGEDRQAQ